MECRLGHRIAAKETLVTELASCLTAAHRRQVSLTAHEGSVSDCAATTPVMAAQAARIEYFILLSCRD